MSLSDLASIGTFVSALGVLVSLVYLSAQVRQATKHQQAQLLEARTERVVDWQMRLAEPGLANLWHKLLTGAHDYTDVEASQLAQILRSNITNGEVAYLQHAQGLIGDRAFEMMRRNWVGFLSWPAYRVFWERYRGRAFLDAGFVAWVDEQLAKTAPYRPVSAAELNAAIAAQVQSAARNPSDNT
jgi:hypothetical protein